MSEKHHKKTKTVLINDHYQNFKGYQVPPAQLVIADVPYQVGKNAYGSNPSWYVDGDNKKGESDLAGTAFFDTDEYFKPAEFMHFCQKLIKKEPKQRGQAGCMIIFCSFEQQTYFIDLAKRYGINNYINLVFRKNYSAQVLKANMRVVSNSEYGLILYRDKLPKFNNNGKMVFNIIDWVDDERDETYKKIHPTQKPVNLIKKLIEIFTDEGDIVIDPVAGSGSTLIAAQDLKRSAYGFEIKKEFYKQAKDWIEIRKRIKEEEEKYGYSNIIMRMKEPKQEVLFQIE
jgi:site-specific DNA-methyltransferase (adenine-specific)